MDQNCSELIATLESSPRITASLVASAPTEQGVYVLWLQSEPQVCLKVGIAGPRSGKGLRERLSYHFSGNDSISVLSRHLAADSQSTWVSGYELTNQQERKRFLSERCFFQALALPGLTRGELLGIEEELILNLAPRYAGRVKRAR